MKNYQFVQEFESQSRYLKHFALRLTNDKNMAEDLFQETALKAFKYRNKFTPNTNLKAWLGTIMKNSFINLYRKSKKRNQIQDTTPEAFFLNNSKNTTSNDGEMSMIMKELFGLIDTLDDSYKIPLMMRYHGYSYEEITKALNLPLGTIKSRIFHARKILRNKINKVNNYVLA